MKSESLKFEKLKKLFLEKLSFFLGSLIIFLGALAFYFKFYPFEFLNYKIYDVYFKLRGKVHHSDKVVIVAIDEKSLKTIGRWPWSRNVLARLIKKLSQDGAYIIGMDIILSEPEKHDQILAQAISEAGNVVLPIFFSFKKGELKPVNFKEFYPYLLDIALSVEISNKAKKFAFFSAKEALFPEKIFIENALSLGHINIFPDPDGVTRKEVLYIEYKGLFIPALSLQIATLYKGLDQDSIKVIPGRGIFLGKTFIPTDKYGRIFIPYYGPNYTFKHISAIDVLQNKVPKDFFKNKIVLIGATATGLYDLRVTPFSPVFFGVEKHANVIEALLSNNIIKTLPNPSFYLLYFLISFLVLFIVLRFSAVYSAILSFIFILGSFIAGYILFVKFHLWIDMFYPAFSVFLIFLVHNVGSYIYTEKKSREIKRIFASYVTPQVMEELIKKPELAKLGGERREVSILFSDIRGFTTLSERLQPEEVVNILNEYFQIMVDVIFKWQGTLDKFIGDAIMVFWGAPLYQEDHTLRAISCALDMVEALKKKNKEWQNRGLPELKIGIGINTGVVLVGNIGVEGRKMDYTVIGDNVNLASRLESLNKKFNTQILVSEYTLKPVKQAILKGALGGVTFEEIGEIVVKGKTKPVKVYKAERNPKGKPEIIELKTSKIIVMKEK